MTMTARPWLSVLIPTHNVQAYIHECIHSVLSQATQGVEIIVVDDGSADDTLQIVQSLALACPIPFQIIQHPQALGVSAARNTLLDAAQGQYAWFIDSDDRMHPGAISELAAIVRTHEPDLVMCNFSVLRRHSRLKHRLRGEHNVSTFVGATAMLASDPIQLFTGLFLKRNLHLWSKIAKRELWADDLRFPVGKIMEDATLSPQLCLRVQTYYYHPSPWVEYRQREGSILTSFSMQKIDDSSLALAGILALWLQKYPGLPRRARLAFCCFCLRLHARVVRDLRLVAPDVDLNLYRQRLLATLHWRKTQVYWELIKAGRLLRLVDFLRSF